MLTKKQISDLAKEFGGSTKNTGSAAVQIAILTHEIKILTEHFKTNTKDLHSRVGFVAKIEQRKKLLDYLRRDDFTTYQTVIKKLDIRK